MGEKIWVRADYISSNLPRHSTLNLICPTRCLRVLLSQVNKESESLACVVIIPILRLGKGLWRWYALRMCCAQTKTKKRSVSIGMTLVGCSLKREFLSHLLPSVHGVTK